RSSLRDRDRRHSRGHAPRTETHTRSLSERQRDEARITAAALVSSLVLLAQGPGLATRSLARSSH
ncbi:hypothetical protein, partial [Microbacterium yannicii]|uniref:hypothetical protein n=1 Tax=Microbacterium yannicii TaxID=671622 RepID=UPI00209283B1